MKRGVQVKVKKLCEFAPDSNLGFAAGCYGAFQIAPRQLGSKTIKYSVLI